MTAKRPRNSYEWWLKLRPPKGLAALPGIRRIAYLIDRRRRAKRWPEAFAAYSRLIHEDPAGKTTFDAQIRAARKAIADLKADTERPGQ